MIYPKPYSIYLRGLQEAFCYFEGRAAPWLVPLGKAGGARRCHLVPEPGMGKKGLSLIELGRNYSGFYLLKIRSICWRFPALGSISQADSIRVASA